MTIDCIILAAGAATRFGSCKLIADYRGKPLVANAIDAAKALVPERIILVTGASHDVLEKYCATLNTPALELLCCDDWRLGMGHSLAYAARQLNGNNPILILLGDQPRVNAVDLQRLYLLWLANPAKIICASFADTVGVPAIFPAAFKQQLSACAGDRGAKPILFNFAQQVVAVHMPAAEFDIDTPEDLQRELAIS